VMGGRRCCRLKVWTPGPARLNSMRSTSPGASLWKRARRMASSSVPRPNSPVLVTVKTAGTSRCSNASMVGLNGDRRRVTEAGTGGPGTEAVEPHDGSLLKAPGSGPGETEWTVLRQPNCAAGRDQDRKKDEGTGLRAEGRQVRLFDDDGGIIVLEWGTRSASAGPLAPRADDVLCERPDTPRSSQADGLADLLQQQCQDAPALRHDLRPPRHPAGHP